LSWASEHYDRTIAFYRDAVGLPFIGDFTESFGEDGTIFGLPGLAAHLEIVRGGDRPAGVDRLDQLVLYLSGAEAVAVVAARLQAAGVPTDPDPHPYWAARDAVVFLDPDGRRVALAPWVFGQEQEPHAADRQP
jgi:catechol 2,3-dioxygenase-like lactoylglutathione lyase family enzyme